MYQCQTVHHRKTCSIDISLVSYSFFIRLINRLFDLNWNFKISTQNNTLISDDFDLDNYLLDSSNKELRVDLHDIDDWCIIEQNVEEIFDLIHVTQDAVIVTNKTSFPCEETFLQRATHWLHGSIRLEKKKLLTKKEFQRIFQTSTGQLLNETVFRQRIFQTGCEPSIRHTVWCYLFRVYDRSMTRNDRIQYGVRAKQRYAE